MERLTESSRPLHGSLQPAARPATAAAAPVNAMTIDVEDWHQLAFRKLLGYSIPPSRRVVVYTDLILELLAEQGVRATFFVLGTVAEVFPELVRRISEAGHEVATHGLSHRRINSMEPKVFEAELHRSIQVLEDASQQRVWGHRAAEFSVDGSSLWMFESLVAAGLRYDSSIFPIRHPRYGMPDAVRQPHLIHTPAGTLVEFPLATLRQMGQNLPIAGGGYLRVLPLGFIQRGIQSLNRQGQVAVVYVHPYEFDDEWLDLSVPNLPAHRWLALRMRALKRNWGRGRPMLAKFRTLLGSAAFAPLREVMVHGTEWQSTDVLSAECSTVRPTVSTGCPTIQSSQ
jgi:polysaccharide deacetylase family protein (PEP-CTERM system associated)